MEKYIQPLCETTALFLEDTKLMSESIPMGGETGHFDTKGQNEWSEEWYEETDM